MEEEARTGGARGTLFLVAAAGFVIVVAGMRAASSIVVPFLLAVFIAIICTPPLFWMQRKRIPDALAVLFILTGIVTIGVFLAIFLGASLNSFINELPAYEASLASKTAALTQWLKGLGLDVSEQVLRAYFDPGKAMSMAANTLAGLSKVLTNLLLILLTVSFILFEASGFPRKLESALKDPGASLARFGKITESVKRYLAIKSLFSIFTGMAIWIWLSILGVDYPLLWGVLAFLLNYVPNIGSIIAAVPAVLLAFIQLGTRSALLVCLGYVVVNVTIGSVIEPRLLGRGLGMSTLVVFVSLVFWGWVLGPVGMLLSVPLTMIVKIALESNEDTRWIAVILGSAPAPAISGKAEAAEGK